MKKSVFINRSILFIFLFCALSEFAMNYAQEPDTTNEKQVQYRRGIELKEGYQSYNEKYAGINLNELKNSLFPLQNTGVWTELHPRIPRVTYLGVNFINANIGWAVGNLGAVIKTTDGGNSWTVSETNTTTLLLKVHSYDGQSVIAAGYNGFILRSTDGGETFEQILSGTTNDLWGLQMLNDTLGFACGLNQTLLKTMDGGLTWQPLSIGLNQHYWSLDFLDENYGMIACGGGKILKTTNGGDIWTEHQAGDASALYAIDIIDSLHIAAVGANGKNVYSSDGGISWTQNNRLQHDELNSIKFVNTETGYTIGTYLGDSWGIRKTTNRGATWFSPSAPNLSEWELELLPDGVGYSVGSNLWINKTTGGYDNWDLLFLNANFVDVFFTDELTGYAADGRYTGGPLYKTTDGGLTWFALPNFPSNVFTSSLRSIYFTDSVTGFAGSAPARIVKTTDAGESWYIVNRTGLTDTIGLINRFFFINPTTGWAVTTRGGIIKTTDAGENWFAQLNAGVSVIFQSIHFVDSLYGWTANSNARPYKTTDGGNNWVLQSSIIIGFSLDVYFSHQDTGWIINTSLPNALYKTTDNGANWKLITDILSARNFGFFPDKYHWLVSGFGAYLYETTDGGQTFIDISNEVPSSFNKFSAPVDYLGYAIGSLGLVLKYLDTSYIPVELISFTGAVENHRIILLWQTSSELNNQGFHVEKSFDKEKWLSIGFVKGFGTTTNINNYSFIDSEITSGIQFYKLKQIDYDGSFEYSKIIEVNSDIAIPTFHLFQNYPNPFNSSTIINYQVPVKSLTNISVYDIKGEKILELVNDEKEKGLYKTELSNNKLPSGVYFARMMTSTGYRAIIKLTLIK